MHIRIVALLAWCAAGAACGRPPAAPGVPARPDLLLITIDTLRADRVGPTLTPTLDRLAGAGLRFTQARAPAPLTLPSHVSMLTGARPPEHGVRENGIHIFRGTPRSVARTLQERGYRTAAFVAAYVLDRRFGLSDGFEHYDDLIARDPNAVHRLEAERPAREVVDRAAAWLPSVPASEALFLWVHFYDPHAPYEGSYDSEVTVADAQAGRLLDALRGAGRMPVVVVAGDHGESLGEHGEATHGMLLYEAAIRVPLIVSGPGVPQARRDDPVSLIDVAPTLAALAGAPEHDVGAARSLLEPAMPGREIYAETVYPRVAGWSPVHALVGDRWKLIRSREAELYDLASDAGESANVAGTGGATVTAMAARLDGVRSAKPSAAPASPPPDAAAKLRALGYVAAGSGSAPPADAPNPAEHIDAWRTFEAALVQAGQRDRRALEPLRRLAAAFPRAPVFQSTYARTLAEQGSFTEALAIYRRAVAAWPDDAALYHELAVAARESGRRDEAVKAEQAALALEPTLPSAHNGLGLLMTDAGRHADAAAAFARAAAADPTNAEYWVNLGNAQRAAGNGSEAAAAYRRAAEIDPSSADAANGLGVLLVQQRRAAEAIPLLERAVAVSPDFIEARLNLGIAHQESGHRDEAIALYRDVIARAKPGSPERRAAAELLRSLGR